MKNNTNNEASLWRQEAVEAQPPLTAQQLADIDQASEAAFKKFNNPIPVGGHEKAQIGKTNVSAIVPPQPEWDAFYLGPESGPVELLASQTRPVGAHAAGNIVSVEHR